MRIHDDLPWWVHRMLSGHLQPPRRVDSLARLCCPHIPWATIREREPALFEPIPPWLPELDTCWAAIRLGIVAGVRLALDVELATPANCRDPRLMVTGLGTTDTVSEEMWLALAPLLHRPNTLITTSEVPVTLPTGLPAAAGWLEATRPGTWWHYIEVDEQRARVPRRLFRDQRW
ncbi:MULTISPECIES: hypothetical protein [unclassified Crossiella]|uniref:hypothetical protein n=1 Tax=unclassified Crossiella TaxID=2620835 RepID=UPI001FFF8DA1|nr:MULTISPECIES: hypothetical protein [unclassified Crossiella]MCK2239973.1 hypothetical protein [Crossiella sp. S99.2]MCK2252681.1 hypothetical protein [Crossiella sp. S99.1]